MIAGEEKNGKKKTKNKHFICNFLGDISTVTRFRGLDCDVNVGKHLVDLVVVTK